MLLVTGAYGQLGQELRLLLGEQAMYVGRADLDITNEEAVKGFFTANHFDFIINCAAYTAVDRAEDDEKNADLVNRHGAGLLARYGRRIIHISTDYVFDGKSPRPYIESDAPNPISVYGRTKLAGEKAVLEHADTAVVIRTSWLYSRFGHNFVKTIRRLGAKQDHLNVVFDQIGSPTYAADLAAVITTILPQLQPGMKKIYHYSNEGVASWYDLAYAVMRESAFPCLVNPVGSADYPTRAARPSFSVLNKTKIKNDFSVIIPHWRDGLERYIHALKNI